MKGHGNTKFILHKNLQLMSYTSSLNKTYYNSEGFTAVDFDGDYFYSKTTQKDCPRCVYFSFIKCLANKTRIQNMTYIGLHSVQYLFAFARHALHEKYLQNKNMSVHWSEARNKERFFVPWLNRFQNACHPVIIRMPYAFSCS